MVSKGRAESVLGLLAEAVPLHFRRRIVQACLALGKLVSAGSVADAEALGEVRPPPKGARGARHGRRHVSEAVIAAVRPDEVLRDGGILCSLEGLDPIIRRVGSCID